MIPLLINKISTAIILLSVCPALVILMILKRRTSLSNFKEIPGPTLNFTKKRGNFTNRISHLTAFYADLYQYLRLLSTTGFVKASIDNKPWVFVVNRKSFGKLLETDAMKGKPMEFEPFSACCPKAFIFSDKEGCSSRGARFFGGYTIPRLDLSLTHIIRHINLMCDKMRAKAPDNLEVDVHYYACCCIIELLTETFFGVCSISSPKPYTEEFYESIYTINELVDDERAHTWYALCTPTGIRWTRASNHLRGFLNKLRNTLRFKLWTVPEHKDSASALQPRPSGIKGILKPPPKVLVEMPAEDAPLPCTSSEKLPRDVLLQDDLIAALLKGHASTVLAATWTLINLSINEEQQTNMRQSLGDLKNELKLENLGEIESGILESMRLFPPIPFYLRKLKTDLQIGEYGIRAGTMIAVAASVIQNNKEQFPNPSTFDPQRTPVVGVPTSFVPFSEGPRKCPGEQIGMTLAKLVVAQVLKRFHFTKVSSENEETCTSLIANNFTIPVHGHKIRLERSL